ncbi:high nitrogen upregulated cytochrome P450 monooxygenase 2 [Lentinus tigrinus ALCF2SS1-6]|uniref:High nitrogen upregulated cytochrome P450 monooxygenase 2 n=1 Tax=Lentinus tigrinus ALCF2SS1-6 TaxID=1328759 RepID=A0A5C2RRP4_9APHY|nr:high nitrogen upregulated cytochrome P450 monooxygenase 2 [Lentinus tigrinus ALCF2SS1-6]
MSDSEVVCALVFLALIAHEIFKRVETYSIGAHAALLLGPPALASPLLVHSGHHILRSIFNTYTTYLGALAAFTILYRTSPFHPLAQHPGPLGCRISQWWMACVSWSGREHLYINELHCKYGDVVRIGPNELSIRDASAVGPIMNIAKGPQYVGRMLSDGVQLPLIGIQDPAKHSRRRRPWNRAFSAPALRGYEKTIARRAQQLLEALERCTEAQEKVVLGKWFNYFAYDFMCDMAFGGGSELLREGDANNVWRILDEGMKVGTLLAHVPWLGVYLSHVPLATGALNVLIAHCRKLTIQRIERGATRKDLFHYLNDEDISDSGSIEKPPPRASEPALRQLTDDGCLVVVAGADTTSSALSSLFYCLLTNPETYKRLQAEVDRFYPTGAREDSDVFNTKDHRDMHWLNAVIYETLRLFPPVPGGSQRQVPRESGVGVIAGKTYIPPGTAVWAHTWSIHRDPRNFTKPDAFWPERWLLGSTTLPSSTTPTSTSDSEAAESDSLQDSKFVHKEDAWMPFAHGPMNCVGKNLALLEIRMVVCALMQRFEMRLLEGWDAGEYERNFRAYLVATRPVVPVRLMLRSV